MPVDGAVDVTVPCSGNAVFEHSPVKVGVPHFIQARATVGATTFITSSAGEGFTTRGANTVVTIDTQAQ